jgi:DNA-binding NarL/FixJ family response regulator
MAREVLKNPILVSVLSENCLVSAYLVGLLRQDASFRTVSMDAVQRHGVRADAPLTFVIDASTLASPVGHCLRQLRQLSRSCRFLILDEERNNEEAVRLLLSGAHGFLPHSQVGMRLGRAVRFIANGHFWVAPGVFESYLTQMRKGSNDARQVTPRESEILDLLRLRLSNKEIAEYLRIRVSTVKFHVTHILSKLQISSRQDLFTDDFRGFLNKLPLT